MNKIKLEKIRELIGESKIDEAIDEFRVLASQLDGELYNISTILKSDYSDWNNKRIKGLNHTSEDINRIKNNLLDAVTISEEKLSRLADDADIARNEGDYHRAIDLINKILIIVDNKELRDIKLQLGENLFDDPSPTIPKIEKFSFIWTFITVTLISSLVPTFLYFNYLKSKPTFLYQILYIINLIFQIALLMCMVLYKIKPLIVVDEFIKKAPENIRIKFESKINELKWFSERANEAIKQFGIWWRLLGLSYLSLYVLYYFYWILDVTYNGFKNSQYHSFFDKADDFVDVIINGSEGFFLFILYRIVTENTLKPSPSRETFFEEDLNYQKELGIATVLLFAFFVISFVFIYTPDIYHNYGLFSLVSRTISGTVVSIGLCLVVGRLDSKFVDPKEWQLILLYSYAAIQLLFTLFDPTLILDVVRQINQTPVISEENLDFINSYVGNIKMIVLYCILFLKGYFIYFIINIHRKHELFYYFLLGSKLNDEIAKGRND